MSKYDYLADEISELKKLGMSYAGISKELIKRHDLGLSWDSFRKDIAKLHKKSIENTPFEEFANKNGIPLDKVHSYWDKSSKEYSVYLQENGFDISSIVEKFEDVVAELEVTFQGKKEVGKQEPTNKALKAIRSDCHIGMNPNPDNSSLFKYEYNAETYKRNTDEMFNDILKEKQLFGKFEYLFLEDFGDKADGWNGYTTRGGHELPQNMSNEEVFKVAVETEVELIKNVIDHDIADKVVIRAVGNDNHSGSFGRIINEAVKMIIERVYDSDIIEIHTLKDFIETYTYGKHTFLLTHGKDEKVMKRGLPLNLDPKTINFINDYIDHYEINTPYIHVQKGDLHQVSYHRTNKFDYRNFMSFAPPSSWVQGNFGDCYAGYSLQIIEKDKQEIKHIDKFFEMKKVF